MANEWVQTKKIDQQTNVLMTDQLLILILFDHYLHDSSAARMVPIYIILCLHDA